LCGQKQTNTETLQKIFFCVLQKKANHTGLERVKVTGEEGKKTFL